MSVRSPEALNHVNTILFPAIQIDRYFQFSSLPILFPSCSCSIVGISCVDTKKNYKKLDSSSSIYQGQSALNNGVLFNTARVDSNHVLSSYFFPSVPSLPDGMHTPFFFTLQLHRWVELPGRSLSRRDSSTGSTLYG
ncbi:hypothetical protein QR685DRAFT_171867 [Neurospora intermedia]|uniref:Uncharacterized protein n=1 Tax=Neurospora intermedia TaxID=5142 RepID=A0ABR3DN45_NEUIN